MYFKNIAEKVGIVPEYMIKDIMAYDSDIQPVKDYRAVLGKENLIQNFAKMSPELQRQVTQVSSYILASQLPILKDMVIYESLLVNIPEVTSTIVMPTRYLCRVGELIIVPLRGGCVIDSEEFPSTLSFEPGNLYRINNRVDSTFMATPDFLCVAFNLLDFDLRRYLMPHDLRSAFIRRKDEHLNPNEAPDNPGVPKDAY